MRRTSSSIGESVSGLLTKRKLDSSTLEELEDVLVRADLGIETAARIAAAIGEGRYDKEISTEEVKRILAGEVEKILAPVAIPLAIDRAKKPFVLLMIGVNGSGKTTTIGKLARKLAEHGRSVLVGAADTFRAAAEEQLEIWAERAGADFVGGSRGAVVRSDDCHRDDRDRGERDGADEERDATPGGHCMTIARTSKL